MALTILPQTKLNQLVDAVAKKPTNKKNAPRATATDPKPKAARPPLKRSEFGKTDHHYMIDHDHTMPDIAHSHR